MTVAPCSERDLSFWLGISDMQDGHHRYESDKKKVESGMWYRGLREYDPDEHCVKFNTLQSEESKNPSWWREHCTKATHYSICEEIQ